MSRNRSSLGFVKPLTLVSESAKIVVIRQRSGVPPVDRSVGAQERVLLQIILDLDVIRYTAKRRGQFPTVTTTVAATCRSTCPIGRHLPVTKVTDHGVCCACGLPRSPKCYAACRAADADFATATCGAIRLKLLRIGAIVRFSVRGIGR